MPRDRVPQNSASSSHRTLFSDLQAVYQKIIQTNGSAFPFRSKDNRQASHTAPASSNSRQPLAVRNSLFATRTPSACSSVEEIVIKPLQFHDRLTYTSCSSRCQTQSSVADTVSLETRLLQCDDQSDLSSSNGARFVKVRARSSLAAPTEYSEQSIRYVTEQVSLEQARQLKLRSNVKQHRVDRRYFVSGSKMHIQKQAFEEAQGELLQLNKEKRLNGGNMRHCRRVRPPVTRTGSRKGLTVTGRSLNEVNISEIKANSNDTGKGSAVAIPTATNSNKTNSAINLQINPLEGSTGSSDHTMLLDSVV